MSQSVSEYECGRILILENTRGVPSINTTCICCPAPLIPRCGRGLGIWHVTRVRLSAAPRPSESETCTLQREDSAQDGGVLAGVRPGRGDARGHVGPHQRENGVLGHEPQAEHSRPQGRGSGAQAAKEDPSSSPPVVVNELMGYDILVASSMISPLNPALPSLCLVPNL